MSSIRALAEELASWGNEALRKLFTARPDLISPGVPDFAALAARACARISLQRALEGLHRPELQLLEAVVLTTDEDEGRSTSAIELHHVVGGASLGTLDALLGALAQRALVYRAEPPENIHSASGSRRRYVIPVARLREVLGSYPAGLGRPYTELLTASPHFAERSTEIVNALGFEGQPSVEHRIAASYALERWAALPEALDGAPEHTGELLARFLHWPVASVPGATSRVTPQTSPERPVDWLLSRGLLVPLDEDHVELPRALGLALREGKIVRELAVAPRPTVLKTTDTARRRNAALGAVAEVLRLVSTLATEAGERPVTTLRSGGVGLRELRRLSTALRTDPGHAAFALEMAVISGVLTLDPDTSQWRASGGEAWLRLARHEQWLRLAASWLDTPRIPSLSLGTTPPPAGGLDPEGRTSGDQPRPAAPLSSEAQRPDAAPVRRRVLEIAVELTEETILDEGRSPVVDDSALHERIGWLQPRLERRLRGLLDTILREAALLGVTGAGALTDAGRALILGDYPKALSILEDLLPPAVDRLLIQADLTAIAPGYLDPELAAKLSLLADPEGQGPATVYRFSSASLRRALDAGEDAASIRAFLQAHSATDIPQALGYLVDDTAARHGLIRVGQAISYVQVNDEAALAALLHEPAAAQLGLTRLAPTVAVSNASPREMAIVLRELGLSPSLEKGTDPVSRLRGAGQRTAETSLPPPEPPRASPTPEDVEAQLLVLRTGSTGIAEEAAPSLGLETLQTAIRTRRAVRLSLVDALGNASVEELRPVSISGGRVRVFDPGRDTEKVLSIHRIIDVELA